MELQFEVLVDSYYQPLYRFALSLSRREADAADLTQQTFFKWATKGKQLRDPGKVKAWLFTTLHREFLSSRRRGQRFPHHDVEEVAHELPVVQPVVVNELDGGSVMEALQEVDEIYRAPLTLFYLEQLSYKEIAELLGVPIGTVMSRLSRGKDQLKKQLTATAQRTRRKIVAFENEWERNQGEQ